MEIKREYLDTVILFNRKTITLRFLDKSQYPKLYELCPEYFMYGPNENKKPTKWSDRFESTPLFKNSELKSR